MEEDLGDFDAGGSTNSDNEKVDSILIKKILCEMKSEFNRATCSIENDANLKEGEEEPAPISDADSSIAQSDSKLGNGYISEPVEPEMNDEEVKPEDSVESSGLNSNGTSEVSEKEEPTGEKTEDKPRIVLTLRPNEEETPTGKKKTVKIVKEKVMQEVSATEEGTEKKGRRSLRNLEKYVVDLGLKRSSRRMSRESVLQSAIALKEKSFGSLNSAEDKPHRRSSRFSDGDQKGSTTGVKGKHAKNSRYSHLEVSETNLTVTAVKKTYLNRVTKLSSDNEDNLTKVEIDDESLTVDNDNFCATKLNTKVEEVTPKTSKRSNKPVYKDMWADSDSCSNGVTTKKTAESSPSKGGNETTQTKIEKINVGLKRKSREGSSEEKKQRLNSPPSAPESSEPALSVERIPTILMANSGSLCECQTNDELYPGPNSFTAPQYCKAIDTFENRHIGCCNVADLETPLLRPSKTVPHLILCKEHVQRLLRHNACPSCGLFCTQGVFMFCNSYHYYHKDCELKMYDSMVCPHCGSRESKEVKISLGAHKYPVFLPMQKPPSKYPSARMSFSNGSSNGDKPDHLLSRGELVPEKCLVLPSGRRIVPEGIPSFEKEKLENLLHVYPSENVLLQRFTYRNLYQATKSGLVEKMLQILSSGVSPNQALKEGGGICALHAAARNGHLSAVHILIQAGANLDVLDREQYTPLMLAALNSHNHIVKYLVKAGACVAFKGADGMTALHIAAKEGNLEGCQHLLSSANTPQSYVDTVDDGRWTPLVWAAENCCTSVVRFLLENKADPQIRDSEMNIALHWAAFAGSMEIIEDLLNYGSNINLSNTHGDTPLHIASRQGAENCVILLLARGARVDMMNKAGQVPRDCSPDENYCYTAIDLNMFIRRLMVTTNNFPRILSNDISRGYEFNPIQCVNAIDDDGLPTDFTYITENCLTTNLNIDRRITSLTSCKCEDNCTGAGCLCAKISFTCWYDSKEKLLPDFNFEDPPMIFECNQTCDCNGLTCKNRVVQRGIKIRMQLCKTRHKNWGVITLKEIPKGSYVCEYIGEIISDCEADTREDDSYLFDLDSRDGETYCIDARRYGNIARFINHSCKPNLSPVRVFIGHHDLHFPRIAFFANRDIHANEELGFDYGEKFWIIKCKSFTCMCASDNCRYSDEKIQDTLEKYREKMKLEETT